MGHFECVDAITTKNGTIKRVLLPWVMCCDSRTKKVAVKEETKQTTAHPRHSKPSRLSSFSLPLQNPKPKTKPKQRLPRQGHLRPPGLRSLHPPLRPLALDLFHQVEPALRRARRRECRGARRAAGDELCETRGPAAGVRALRRVRARDGLRGPGVVEAPGELAGGYVEKRRRRRRERLKRGEREFFPSLAHLEEREAPPQKKRTLLRRLAPSPSPR